jgi:putative FmdB family regulatory protein
LASPWSWGILQRAPMTYEYHCTDPACQHAWEAEQKISEIALRVCPKCGKQTAKRLISQGTFVINGPGWFKTGGY